MKNLLILTILAATTLAAIPAKLSERSAADIDPQDNTEHLARGAGYQKKGPGHEKENYAPIMNPYQDEIDAADVHAVLGE
ncbi:hypothetical protein PMZ80_001771 [Knufia obscura]|uniref:Uncharacterized protein n=2 Tax=Knufia TaxID=430999 RepID=A0AAN8EJL1_9EURO|nr:hypothetical protein PMZ80_001771 [Knufia obscura]KAK5955405.1 hypothetical protein OHC33_003043 [Knufia fluminis]